MGLASARSREKDHAKMTSAFASCRDQRRCEYKRLNPAGDTSRGRGQGQFRTNYSAGSGSGSGTGTFSFSNFSLYAFSISDLR